MYKYIVVSADYFLEHVKTFKSDIIAKNIILLQFFCLVFVLASEGKATECTLLLHKV